MTAKFGMQAKALRQAGSCSWVGCPFSNRLAANCTAAKLPWAQPVLLPVPWRSDPLPRLPEHPPGGAVRRHPAQPRRLPVRQPANGWHPQNRQAAGAGLLLPAWAPPAGTWQQAFSRACAPAAHRAPMCKQDGPWTLDRSHHHTLPLHTVPEMMSSCEQHSTASHSFCQPSCMHVTLTAMESNSSALHIYKVLCSAVRMVLAKAIKQRVAPCMRNGTAACCRVLLPLCAHATTGRLPPAAAAAAACLPAACLAAFTCQR